MEELCMPLELLHQEEKKLMIEGHLEKYNLISKIIQAIKIYRNVCKKLTKSLMLWFSNFAIIEKSVSAACTSIP